MLNYVYLQVSMVMISLGMMTATPLSPNAMVLYQAYINFFFFFLMIWI